MNKRIQTLANLIDSVESLADVGCDHGLLTLSALNSGKCKWAIISDVSEKCLLKARELLKEYVLAGKVIPVCTNGLDGLREVDLVIIAGMGGEETVSILTRANFLPDRLLLQPMKNTEKVRKTIASLGYYIEKDFTFYVKDKYYDVIKAKKGKDSLTEEELEFGRTNLLEKPKGFIKKLNAEKQLLTGVLENGGLSEKAQKDVLIKLRKIEKYV